MLETPEERTKLMKAGLTGEQIEQIYVHKNGYTINRDMVLREI